MRQENDAERITSIRTRDGGTCGTSPVNRNTRGDGSTRGRMLVQRWFQDTRTAYGWYLYGRETHKRRQWPKRKAWESRLFCHLKKARRLSHIYGRSSSVACRCGLGGYPRTNTIPFCMSGKPIGCSDYRGSYPQRSREGCTLQGLRRVAGASVAERSDSFRLQLNRSPRAEFRDFNLQRPRPPQVSGDRGSITGISGTIVAAEKSHAFVTREVFPGSDG